MFNNKRQKYKSFSAMRMMHPYYVSPSACLSIFFIIFAANVVQISNLFFISKIGRKGAYTILTL